MKKIPLVLLIFLFLFGCSKGGGASAIGTIKTPWGDKIKVIFTGPPELEDKWEKIGMPDPYQVQLTGTITNKSNQSVSFEQIAFLFDSQQVGFDAAGATLAPGESVEIMWAGAPVPGAKTLEVRVVGFRTTTPPTQTPTPIPTQKPTLSPEEVVTKWYNLMKQGKFAQAMELYGPETRQKMESKGGATYLKNEWEKNPIIEFEIKKVQIEPNQKEAQVYVETRQTDGTYRYGEPTQLYKIGNEWKIGY